MDDSKLIERFTRAQENLVIQASDFSLQSISGMVNNGSIDISPHYQRRERWTLEKQSALIESFLINVPIPPVYLSEDEYGSYSVIDGKQRITSIHLFLTDTLVLRGLKELPELNERRFSQLPTQLSRTLEVRPFLRAITLLKQSDPDLKYEVFTRLNRGGERLTSQEVRNVAYRGPLNDLVYELAEHPFLRQQLKITGTRSPFYRDMLDAEYVLRFLMLREKWRLFSGSFTRSLDEFMLKNRRASPARLAEFRSAFDDALHTCQLIWEDHAFQRPVDKNSWRNQTLAAMYDAQMVAVDLLTPEQKQRAIEQRKSIVAATRDLFQTARFEQSVRVATNTPSSVVFRIEKTQKMLTGSSSA